MKTGLKIEFLLNTVSQVVRYFLIGWRNTRKTGILLLRKQERVPKMGRKPKKKPEEMTELERLQEENERLRTEVAYLKKLKELEERDEALERERQRQLEKWFQEDFD